MLTEQKIELANLAKPINGTLPIGKGKGVQFMSFHFIVPKQVSPKYSEIKTISSSKLNATHYFNTNGPDHDVGIQFTIKEEL